VGIEVPVIDWTATLRTVTMGKGTTYPWAEMPDGFGLPDICSADIDLPRHDGILAGDDFLGGRRLVFDVHINATAQGVAETAVNTLKAVWGPSHVDVPLDLRLTGTPTEYRLYGRPRGCSVQLDRKFRSGVMRARCEFLATDPRLFGAETTTVIGLPAGTAGLLFPAEAPFVFGGLSSPGEALVNNTGTYETDWTATFTGPLTSPIIEHVGLGRSLSFTGLTIATGETLELDSRTKSALLNGTASRYSSLSASSRWWTLPVGNSTIRFRAGSGSGILTVRHRPAYL